MPLALSLLFLNASLDAQAQGWLDKAKKAVKDYSKDLSNVPLTEEEAAKGIREALSKGVTKGSEALAMLDGYYANPQVKIPFPQDAQKVENTLRKAGLGSKVDDAVLSINRAAEQAAIEAKPIFLEAITALTVQDALGIVKGNDNAATEYLKRSTTSQLTQKFSPIIAAALEKVQATKYWETVMKSYNSIPFVDKVNTDLTAYATQKAIDGLFVMIAKEEQDIRTNPLARSSELLKKVFGAN